MNVCMCDSPFYMHAYVYVRVCVQSMQFMYYNLQAYSKGFRHHCCRRLVRFDDLIYIQTNKRINKQE